MGPIAVAADVSVSIDLGLAQLVDQLTAGLRAGGAVDCEKLIVEFPQYADQLRQLLPAMALLAEVSRTAGQSADGFGTPPMPGPDSITGTLGDYRLIREVGRGGMGIVYEAEQITLGRRVALKILPYAAAMDPKQLQRFRNEAKAAASLHHNHIVPIHAVGCERGVHYYAMQFIDGRTLAQVIADQHPDRLASRERERPEDEIPPVAHAPGSPDAPTAPIAALTTQKGTRDKAHYRHLADLIADAADALEHAHSLGIVHRDVKPGNLMVDEAGKLWVADFGLARFGADAGLTVSGDILGTLRYMAPEQALARHGLVDHRADIYGLGTTLYELLTGRPAVNAVERAEILRQIAYDDPTPPRTLERTIPAELETIALKCLAKNPNERYATASELAEDLRRWLGHQTIKARRPSIRQRLDKWLRRHSAAVLAAAAALLMGTAVST